MRIVESNRLSVLADDLLSHWPIAAPDDLSARHIVVPSLGLGRWLTYRIATAFSVCAQVEFVYPATYVWSLFAKILPELSERSPFDAASLTWRIYRLCETLKPSSELAPLIHYLNAAAGRDRLALARRIAALYGEVLAARPEWAPQWQQNRLNGAEPKEHERWLAALWRLLSKEISAAGSRHPRELVLEALKQHAPLRTRLPASITIFAVPHMAALYQSVFEALSEYSDVTAYLINPSPEFWFDLESKARTARRHNSAQAMFDFEPDGQKLLAALGQQARENLSIWGVADADRQGPHFELEEAFQEPQSGTLLMRLQHQIYGARGTVDPQPLAKADRSLQVHVCHSLSRQLEVLHDQLLDALTSRNPEPLLAPAEVLVLLPDIDAAAPIIEAVFGAALGRRHIPYVISGRAARDTAPLVSAFFDLLKLPFGRFTVSAVADLLATGAVAQRFGITEPMRERLFEWLKSTGVHWGVDADSKAAQGLHADARHTFAEGLASLYLGYASAGDRPSLIHGVVPFDAIEGKDADALGALTRFLNSVTGLKQSLSAARPIGAWVSELNRIVEQFFSRRADVNAELTRIDMALARVAESSSAAQFDTAVTLEVMVDAVRHALAEGAPGAVPTGSVTFTSFGPLRQLPYRFIAMLDLNGDGSFPRNPERPEFDLLRRDHRQGDRSLVDEDRGAFLDGVLAASDRVLCAYSGRSIKDNAALPPSSVVEDLLDVLTDLVAGGRSGLILHQVLIEHPLQPFSQSYFEATPHPAGLFTFASELLPVASGKRAALPEFFKGPLDAPGDEWLEVELNTLVEVLHDPLKFLLTERLGLDLRDDDGLFDDDEPQQLHALDRRELLQRLYALRLAGLSEQQMGHIATQFAQLPEGVLGQLALDPQIDTATRFAAAMAAARPPHLMSRGFALERGRFRIYGVLDGLHPAGRFDAVLSDPSSRDMLKTWIAHLVLHLIEGEGVPLQRRSVLLGAQEIATFFELTAPGRLLDDLLEIYWKALCEPVPLIPKLSLKLVDTGAEARSRKRVRLDFLGGRKGGFARSESRLFRTVYGSGLRELPEGFEEISERVYTMLWQSVDVQPSRLHLDPDDEEAGAATEAVEGDGEAVDV